VGIDFGVRPQPLVKRACKHPHDNVDINTYMIYKNFNLPYKKKKIAAKNLAENDAYSCALRHYTLNPVRECQ